LSDERDCSTDEIATDYNAGFQGAVAAIKQLSLEGILDKYQIKDIAAPLKTPPFHRSL